MKAGGGMSTLQEQTTGLKSDYFSREDDGFQEKKGSDEEAEEGKVKGRSLTKMRWKISG